ncbi:MAG: sulfatase-like hydrolase/transferase [Candidatus Limiplasma sp.]|nr:sulfatase-like hydrolase/transferase [Candidatus Limiplasma sp.]
MKQPAVILITCDELRRDTLGCYGNQAIETPHIDQLAQTGIRMDNFYTVSPWCLPARCSILTGQYPQRSGAYSNFRPCPLDTGIDNVFKGMKRGGYATSLFGKCHFAPVPYDQARPDATLPYDSFRDYYLSLGIDTLALQDDKNVSMWFYDDYSKELDEAGYLEECRRVNWLKKEHATVYEFPAPAQWHPDAWVGRKAAEHIRSAPKDQPLFTWISFSGPHYPYDSPKEYLGRVDESKLFPRVMKPGELDDPGRIHHKSFHGGGNIDGTNNAPHKGCKYYSEEYWRRLRISYNANVALIDDMVGDILEAAHQQYGDNCLVIFTADHGEMLGNHGLWGKHNCGYEEVWKIPMLLRFPHQREQSVSASIANLNDIFPTVMQAAGLEAPNVDGKPLQTQLENGGMDYTFAEGEGYLAVTDGSMKYIHVEKPGEHYRELLDRRADPQEFDNQLGKAEYAPEASRLQEQLINHLMQTVLP